MTLVSPSDVLQEWDVGGANESNLVGPSSPDSPFPSGGVVGDGTSSGTNEPLSAGTAQESARETGLERCWVSVGYI